MCLEGFTEPTQIQHEFIRIIWEPVRTRNSLRMAKRINGPNPQQRQLIRLQQLVGNHTSDSWRVNVLEKIRIQRMKEGVP